MSVINVVLKVSIVIFHWLLIELIFLVIRKIRRKFFYKTPSQIRKEYNLKMHKQYQKGIINITARKL